MRCRGFLLGGTAGRTTLAGEGLQHQDGNSLLNALAFPTVMAYDPCYAYELSAIVLDGTPQDVLRTRTSLLHHADERRTTRVARHAAGCDRRHLARACTASRSGSSARRTRTCGFSAAVRFSMSRCAGAGTSWSRSSAVRSSTVHSVIELTKNLLLRRPRVRSLWNRLCTPISSQPGVSTSSKCSPAAPGRLWPHPDPSIAAVPQTVSPWVGPEYTVLGTDGFGRSEARPELRRFFEVDAENIALGLAAGA